MPKQTSDISGNPVGLQYTAAGLKWTIVKGVEVTGTTAGVYSTFASSKLVNQGKVGGGTYGVYFDAGDQFGNYQVDNRAKAEISSSQYGVYVESFLGSLEINNDGKISGGVIGVLAVGSSDIEFTNTGTISGTQVGILLAGSSVGASNPEVHNHGTIKSSEIAAYFSAPAGVTLKFVNHDGAALKAGDGVALISLSQLNFKNEGTLQGYAITGGFADKIINKGKFTSDVSLGDGIDTFKNKDGGKVLGKIDTGAGNDLVVLGDKADNLLFDSALNAATNVDTVKKFVSGKDSIYLDDDYFSAITPGTLSSAAFHKGASAADADDRIIYDKASGALYYDPDGTGALAQTQFAKFDGGPKLKASDFTIGEYSISL